MNTETFEIKEMEKPPEEEIDKWVMLSDEQANVLKKMNRQQRKEWFSKEMKRIFE